MIWKISQYNYIHDIAYLWYSTFNVYIIIAPIVFK